LKRILLLLFIILMIPAIVFGQSFGNIIQSQTLAASGASALGGVYEAGQNVGSHLLSWTVTATVSACTVQLEASSDGVTYSLMTGTVAQTCTSTGSIMYSGLAANNYVRMNVTALTVSGGGNIVLNYSGAINTVGVGLPVVTSCGSTGTGNQTCVVTKATKQSQVINGTSTLSTSTAVITFPFSFTATTSYNCVANDITTRANPVQMTPTSASTATITNTTGASDVIQWICVGN
jgi:hypothetical protein